MERLLQIIFQKAFEIIPLKKSSTEEGKSTSTPRSIDILLYCYILYF